MNKKVFRFLLIATLLILTLLFANCGTNQPGDETATKTTIISNIQQTPSAPPENTEKPTAEVTPQPSATSLSATFTPTEGVAQSLEPTASPSPTYTRIPTATPIHINPTAAAIPEDNKFLNDLHDLGYNMLYGSSATGPGGHVYSAFIFYDSTFQLSTVDKYPVADNPNTIHRSTTLYDTEGCRIAFYRFDGQENVLIRNFPAPMYPEGSVYHGYPAMCSPNIVDTPFPYHETSSENPFNTRGYRSVWTDINQNGLPEFVVKYQYCSNACMNQGAPALRFYEIQSSSKVVDITDNLPGVIEPTLFTFQPRSVSPLEVYVYDPSLEYCYKWCNIDTWWIYAWDGEQFVNVTPNYAEEYIAEGEEIIQSVKDKYGETFWDSELLSILFLYEKAGRRGLAIDTFLELSSPANWPDMSLAGVCWLQVTRAHILEDYRNNRPFSFPPLQLEGAFFDFIFQLRGFEPEFDTEVYDISACYEYMNEFETEP